MVTTTDSHPTLPNLPTLYHEDYFLWLETTAKQLRNGQLHQLDIDNLAAEIEDMGKSEKRAIESNLEVLLMHLLKYKYQKSKRTNSWRYTIYEHRKRLLKAFKDSPSLRPYFETVFDQCYEEARNMAAIETGMEINSFPEMSPFSRLETLDSDYSNEQ